MTDRSKLLREYESKMPESIDGMFKDIVKQIDVNLLRGEAEEEHKE